MTQTLQDIFQLEDSEAFEEAFASYDDLYLSDKSNYEFWKHLYFFLWIALEDAPSSFHDLIDLRHLLQEMLKEGKQTFADNADFNFIAGYTVGIFPYEFGDYDELYEQAKQMLLRSTSLQPDNLIYKLAYLGAILNVDQTMYKQIKIDSVPKVLETFSGTGALNKYFRQVLYRLDKEA